jgi:hypothetical protein
LKFRYLAGVAVASALVAAGCGSSSSTTSSTGASGASGASGAQGSTPLSQAEFVAKADAICKAANDKVAALKAPQTVTDIAKTLEQELPIVAAGEAQLSQLTPPTELQDKFQSYVAAVEAQTAKAKQLQAAAAANDTAKVKSLGKELQASSPDPIAKSLGLTECAKDVSPQG